MRDYGRVYSGFWASPNIRSLGDDGRLLSLYLLTSPHTTIVGAFRLPDGYVSEDLKWPAARVRKGLGELFENGFSNRCETTKWVWICKFLEWNPPENPNQWKAARKVASQIPDECAWKPAFARVFAEAAGDPLPPEPDPWRTVTQTVSKPGAGTGTEVGTGTEPPPGGAGGQQLKLNGSTANGHADLHAEVVALWHELLPTLPGIKDWNTRRRAKLEARVAEVLKRGKPADTPDYWRSLFARVGRSDLLAGRKTDWRCDLEWLLEPKHFTKLVEGGYDNVRRPGA